MQKNKYITAVIYCPNVHSTKLTDAMSYLYTIYYNHLWLCTKFKVLYSN